jgi:hypothetical protein
VLTWRVAGQLLRKRNELSVWAKYWKQDILSTKQSFQQSKAEVEAQLYTYTVAFMAMLSCNVLIMEEKTYQSKNSGLNVTLNLVLWFKINYLNHRAQSSPVRKCKLLQLLKILSSNKNIWALSSASWSRQARSLAPHTSYIGFLPSFISKHRSGPFTPLQFPFISSSFSGTDSIPFSVSLRAAPPVYPFPWLFPPLAQKVTNPFI